MTAAPVEVDPLALDAAFSAALTTEAAQAHAAEPPPLVAWLNPDGSAKYGYKADGTPKKGPGGPGRGKRGETTPRGDTGGQAAAGAPPASSAAAAAVPQPSPGSTRDYTADIESASFMLWLATASTPWTKGHAAVLKNGSPMVVPALNTACQQNRTVRGWVEKLSGEGSVAWVIPLTMTTLPLAIGLWQVTTDRALRGRLAEQTEADWAEFLEATAAEHGLQLDGAGDAGDAQPPAPSMAA